MPQLKLFLFGAPRVEVDSEPVAFPRRKVLALLIYLALTRQIQRRDALAALFWPETGQQSARAALRRELHALTRAIGSGWLATSRDEITLEANTDVWVDVEEFRQQLAQVAKHTHCGDDGCEICLTTLTRAAALYVSDFLSGFTLSDSPEFDDWQFFEAESLRRELGGVLAKLVGLHERRAEYELAIDYARRWLTLEPMHEPAHRTLMALYARAGQQAAAVRQYDECARILHEELGVGPEQETDALYEAIRTRRFPAPQGQRVPAHADREATASRPPSPSFAQPAVKRHNLPRPGTSFVGRQEELDAIARLLLDEDECRLLTLIGPGGIGKTRLALQVAQQLVDQMESVDARSVKFADGIFWTTLETVETCEQLMAALAEAVGFTFQGNGDTQEQLMHYLEAKQMLLVLDNYEHLLSLTAPLTTLLHSAPAVSILTTSREALALPEEWLYTVGGLAIPSAEANAQEVKQNSAVQLFWQRARRADTSFALTSGAVASVVRICRLVDGLPLGLELAATWMHALPVEEIADEIAANLDFLTATTRGTPERHSSLRIVLEQTWKLLEPYEQEAFCQLSIFHNGFTRQAASRVADVSMMVLAALVRKSIISHNRDGRYIMHGLLRQFAASRLRTNGEHASQVAEKHSRYFGAFVQALEEDLLGTGHAAALEQIGCELENIRHGWRWALSHAGQDAAHLHVVSRYISALFHFYDTRSRFQEGYDEFSFALAQFDMSQRDVQPDPERGFIYARIACRLGWFAFQIDRSAEAKRYLAQSVDVLRKRDAAAEMVFALNYLGAVHRHLEEYAAAQRVLHESEAIARESDDSYGLTVALNILGQVAYLQHEHAQAQAYCEESLALKQAIGDRRGMIFSLLYLGLVAKEEGDYAKASGLLRKSVAISEEHGDRRSVAIGLSTMAEVEALLGNTAGAQTLYTESLHIYSAIHNVRGMVITHMALGDLARTQHDAATAQQEYRRALQLAAELQLPLHVRDALTTPARVWLAQHQPEEASART